MLEESGFGIGEGVGEGGGWGRGMLGEEGEEVLMEREPRRGGVAGDGGLEELFERGFFCREGVRDIVERREKMREEVTGRHGQWRETGRCVRSREEIGNAEVRGGVVGDASRSAAR